MAKKVKFLSTSAGEYGMAHEKDELILKNHTASQLEKAGVVEILGDAGEDEEISQASKGSVRFIDETGTTEAGAGETDPKNPTGPDKATKKPAPPKGATKKGK